MIAVTSTGILTTAEGKRLSVTYSVIDDDGKIKKENQRVNRVVINEDILSHISTIEKFATEIAESDIK